MILILCADDNELSAFLSNADCYSQEDLLAGSVLYKGRIDGHEVALAKTGVGKVLSSLNCQRIISMLECQNTKPEVLLFAGLAGAVDPSLCIGDTLIARDTLQHDLDIRALGYPRGSIPYTQYRFLNSDEHLFQLALSYKPRRGQLHTGRILTGDQFIVDRNSECYAYLREELEGSAVEMEGSAVALCAVTNGLPFLLIRTISDEADGQAKINYREFVKHASENNFALVHHILNQL